MELIPDNEKCYRGSEQVSQEGVDSWGSFGMRGQDRISAEPEQWRRASSGATAGAKALRQPGLRCLRLSRKAEIGRSSSRSTGCGHNGGSRDSGEKPGACTELHGRKSPGSWAGEGLVSRTFWDLNAGCCGESVRQGHVEAQRLGQQAQLGGHVGLDEEVRHREQVGRDYGASGWMWGFRQKEDQGWVWGAEHRKWASWAEFMN